MMLDYKKLLESLLRELIDKKIISEWYCNSAGYFWKYNEKDERIIKLEADNRLLEQRGSDILKELLDKNKKCIELERQIEKMKRHCNCKHRDSEGYCEVKRTYLIDLSYDGCDKWELED